ncbi:MAG: DUF58 domain-containing protein [Anaerolineales bacterium]|nr:DUF58 domain-containing protein [Anaerolineales bacterium]
MPSTRAWSLFILALILYFLANQTQVGWVYIFTDMLIGLLVVAAFYSWGSLNTLQVSRSLRPESSVSSDSSLETQFSDRTIDGPDEFDLAPLSIHEDDPIEVTLQFQHTGLRPALLVGGLEQCPFAPAAEQAQPFFIPALFAGQASSLTYQTSGDRRGVYTFAPIGLGSRGPFGLFQTRRTLAVPGEILIYPAYYPLKRLRLFEKREFAEQSALRLGGGSQVIGTREYRPGDSLRQIHWRSTARTGQLIVKEFNDDEQQAFTVVLDLQADITPNQGKFSPFETAIRLAASFGYYATRKNIPLRLYGASPHWTPPAMPLSWWATLNYLAKVQNDGQEPLAKVLNRLPPSTFVVVLISRPDETIIKALSTLTQPGRSTLTIFITPDGVLPSLAASLKSTHLTVKSVNPYNWLDFLTDL